MSRKILAQCPCGDAIELHPEAATVIRGLGGLSAERDANGERDISAADVHGWFVFWHHERGRFAAVCPAHRHLMPSIHPTGMMAKLRIGERTN